jgi:hypothetical protein
MEKELLLLWPTKTNKDALLMIPPSRNGVSALFSLQSQLGVMQIIPVAM